MFSDTEHTVPLLLMSLNLPFSPHPTPSPPVTFSMTSPTMYWHNRVLSELFLDRQFGDTKNTFRGMTTMEDFWRVSGRCRSLRSVLGEVRVLDLEHFSASLSCFF